ncbi:MAG TPA: hypothetical protein VMB71_14065 [Acetobacteraceae bacterium]|nr:hypothetical protein [Acetobacteraceae bacterium]
MARILMALTGVCAVLALNAPAIAAPAVAAMVGGSHGAPAPVLAAGLPALFALAGGGAAARFLHRRRTNRP